MKKLVFLLLFISPLVLADTIHKKVSNAYSWSSTIAIATDPAWQIHNAPANVNTIYVGPIDITTQDNGYFIFYSTPINSGFTGTRVASSVAPVLINSGSVSISSVSTSAAASAPTGDVVWSGICPSSDTIRIVNSDNPIAVRPGTSLYVIKTNAGALSIKSTVSFYIREFSR